MLVDAISLVLDQRAIFKASGSLIEPAHRETDHSRVYFSARDSVRAKTAGAERQLSDRTCERLLGSARRKKNDDEEKF